MAFYFGDSLSGLLSIKVKDRNDSFFDQIPRVFMSRVFLCSAMVMSIAWVNSETRCIPPKKYDTPDFLNRACWLKGFFVYPNLSRHVEETAYYGIPTELDKNGFKLKETGTKDLIVTLCQTSPRDDKCQPMRKEYFNQYQWMPFYVTFLAFLFYYPYMVFKLSNGDLIELRTSLLNNQVTADDIVRTFFNSKNHSRRQRNIVRLLGNYLVKLLYFMNGILSFIIIDHLTHYRFKSYGIEWIKWTRTLSHTFAEDRSNEATPGNQFLPVFGLCDLIDVRHDLINTHSNKIRTVCEISSHVLYQYTFVIIWFLLIMSIVCSALGLIVYVGNHLFLLLKTTKRDVGSVYYKYMSLRECEYLVCIKRDNLALYTTVKKLLSENLLKEVWASRSGKRGSPGGEFIKAPMLEPFPSAEVSL